MIVYSTRYNNKKENKVDYTYIILLKKQTQRTQGRLDIGRSSIIFVKKRQICSRNRPSLGPILHLRPCRLPTFSRYFSDRHMPAKRRRLSVNENCALPLVWLSGIERADGHEFRHKLAAWVLVDDLELTARVLPNAPVMIDSNSRQPSRITWPARVARIRELNPMLPIEL